MGKARGQAVAARLALGALFGAGAAGAQVPGFISFQARLRTRPERP